MITPYCFLFKYCMKEYYVVGKNLVEIKHLKKKSKEKLVVTPINILN